MNSAGHGCQTLSVRETAAVLGVSDRHLYQLIRDGKMEGLHPRRIGAVWRISQVCLDRYLAGDES